MQTEELLHCYTYISLWIELVSRKTVIYFDGLSLLFSQDCDQLWLMKGMWFVSGGYLGPAQWMKYSDFFQVSINILHFGRQKMFFLS